MATSFPTGFQITSNEPIDSRLVLTKAQMLAMKKAKMPSAYLCVCSDDGQLYLYNSTNEIDSEIGRFRLFKAGSVSTDTLISTDEDNTIIVGEDGTLKVPENKIISEEQIQSLFNEGSELNNGITE